MESTTTAPEAPAISAVATPGEPPEPHAGREAALLRFAIGIILATAATAPGWAMLWRDALRDRLHGYALLIPVIAGWLVWQRRCETPKPASSFVPAIGCLLGAVVAGAGGWLARREGLLEANVSWLSTQMLAGVGAVWAAAFATFGAKALRYHIFAAGFLAFTIPMPLPASDALEIGLQHASADAADMIYRLLRVPCVRDGLAFQLPGLTIAVAQECSGVRSTVVLFITSVLGSYLLLRSSWHRAAIVLLVLPLGVFRNAIRILVISLLSVYVDRNIIDGPIHHRGGPVFFAASLVPLFFMFWWFRRRETRNRKPPSEASAV